MKFLKVGAALFILTVSSQSMASLFSKNPWCESRFQKDPREIQIFKEDLQKTRELSPRKSDNDMGFGEVNKKYGNEFVEVIKSVFATPRYTQMSPELKSRLVAYMLVKVVRIPMPRDYIVVPISIWLNSFINENKNLGLQDLERLRLAYSIFLNRRSKYFDRPHPVLSIVVPTLSDAAISWPVEHFLWHSIASAIVPGWVYFPLPFVTIGRMLFYAGYKRVGDPLGVESLKAVNKLDRKFLDLIGGHLSIEELKKRWDSNLKQVLRKNGTELREGLLLEIVREFCELAKRMHENNPDGSVDMLAYISKNLEAVNPIDWLIVRDAFEQIRNTARETKIPEATARPIFDAMKAVAATWNANAAARRAIDDLLNTSYVPQPLPEQTDTSPHP